MTTFKEIRGTTIEVVSSDPSNPEEGQIWYNSSTGTLRGSSFTAAAWSSGGNLGSAVYANGGSGTKSATLSFAGINKPSSPFTVVTRTESYNGSAWTTVNSMNNAQYSPGSAGTQTSTLAFGGDSGPNIRTESYNGSSWTNAPNLNSARGGNPGGAGSGNTSALCFGSASSPGTQTESYNGSWTTVNSLSYAASYGVGGAGTQTAALKWGGANPAGGNQIYTESWNGSAWTTLSPLTYGRRTYYGSGSQTSALCYPGGTVPPSPANTASTEVWNGTTWSIGASVAAGRAEYGGATAPTISGGAIFGSGTPGNAMEVYTGASVSNKTITVS